MLGKAFVLSEAHIQGSSVITFYVVHTIIQMIDINYYTNEKLFYGALLYLSVRLNMQFPLMPLKSKPDGMLCVCIPIWMQTFFVYIHIHQIQKYVCISELIHTCVISLCFSHWSPASCALTQQNGCPLLAGIITVLSVVAEGKTVACIQLQMIIKSQVILLETCETMDYCNL